MIPIRGIRLILSGAPVHCDQAPLKGTSMCHAAQDAFKDTFSQRAQYPLVKEYIL